MKKILQFVVSCSLLIMVFTGTVFVEESRNLSTPSQNASKQSRWWPGDSNPPISYNCFTR